MKRRSKEEVCEIPIPKHLYDKIIERIRGTDFSSVHEYITFVLEEILSEDEEEVKEEETFTEEDEGKVKERLRGLGYL